MIQNILHILHSTLITFLNPWVLFGLAAQFVYFLRFIIQWMQSEKEKQVVVPVSFWYLSILGTAMILVYSFHIKDVVFILSSILSFFIYFRNLNIHFKHPPVAEEEKDLL
jgi:lipid-A-disaccharide synthase-like uncharacterized protein